MTAEVDVAAGRVTRVETAGKTHDYAATIHPRVTGFRYRFNRMRNLDFATTPQVQLSVQVSARDAAGQTLLDRTYSSRGWFSGRTVMDTMKPGELINRIVHEEMTGHMAEAAADVRLALESRPVAAAPAPAAAPAERAAKPGAPDSLASRLQRLKDLRDKQLISQETYERKSQEILDDL